MSYCYTDQDNWTHYYELQDGEWVEVGVYKTGVA